MKPRGFLILVPVILVAVTAAAVLLLYAAVAQDRKSPAKEPAVEFEYGYGADREAEKTAEIVNDEQDGSSAAEKWTGAETGTEDTFAEEETPEVSAEEEPEVPIEEEEGPEILEFVDAFGESYVTEVKKDVPRVTYSSSGYSVEADGRYRYEDDSYRSRLGVDVSHHQGRIDWQTVKNEGYDFAFLRLGYRGYGETGSINLDKEYDRNAEEARKAGLDVGVYFFAQAVNEEEAAEEAEFVIKHLRDHDINLEVVYDPESILDAKARTDDVSGEQFTKNTQVFCSMISEAGYRPMIYSNMKWEAFEFDMTQLTGYPFWYADYEPLPQTPYDFRYWQYTNEGHVKGISGAVDLDMEFIKK